MYRVNSEVRIIARKHTNSKGNGTDSDRSLERDLDKLRKELIKPKNFNNKKPYKKRGKKNDKKFTNNKRR